MNISDRQRAHARRHATKDAPRYAKGRTVTPEKISTYTEYQASLIGPKREPARTQWKEEYSYHFTAYMINAKAMSPEHEQQERIRLDPGAQPAPAETQMNTAQTIIRAGKDEYGRSNIYAIWQTAGTWYSAQIWQGQRGQPLDQGEPINVQEHTTRQEALARRRSLAEAQEQAATPPAPKIQVTKDGPAYLLPGVDPAPRKRGDADQLTMF